MADPQNILIAKGITKSFPGVTALEDVDFSLQKGEIHALMGENGAGKSTLIKVITGVEHPDRGVIEFDGKHVESARRSTPSRLASPRSTRKSTCAPISRSPKISCWGTSPGPGSAASTGAR